MKKICWIQHASEWPVVEPIARSLEKKDFKTIFVNTTFDIHKRLSEDGFDCRYIAEIFNSCEILSQKELEEIDARYGYPGIGGICASDVHLQDFYDWDETKMEQVAGRAFRYWERFFAQEKPNVVIARETASFATRSAFSVARHLEIPFYLIDVAPGVFTDEFFILCDQEEQMVWGEFLEKFRQPARNLDSSENKIVSDFLDQCRDKWDRQLKIRFIPGSFLKSLKNIAGMTWRINWPKKRHDDPVAVGALAFGRRRLIRRLFWKYFMSNFFSYEKPVQGEKYVYFPFYSPREAMSLTLDHYWAVNELSLVAETAKSLPRGYWLYVKEHPNNPGDFSLTGLLKLKRMNNVRIMHPGFSSPSLIKNSRAVVAMQGSIGWEAFLAKKPIVNFGTCFYSYSPLVYNVGSVSRLGIVLNRALREGEVIYRDNEKDWLWFIYSVLSTMGKGTFCRLFSPPYGFPADKENAERIADFIKLKIKKDSA